MANGFRRAGSTIVAETPPRAEPAECRKVVGAFSGEAYRVASRTFQRRPSDQHR